MFGDILPKISYTTLIHVFLFISFITMAASIAINLAVAQLDKRGNAALGDRLDHRCRVFFPLAYFVLNLLSVLVFFLIW